MYLLRSTNALLEEIKWGGGGGEEGKGKGGEGQKWKVGIEGGD